MKLTRVADGPYGTYGVLHDLEDVPFAVTLENPWMDNQPFISCIPSGQYQCKPVLSPRHGETWEVLNVEGRTHILFHIGNTEPNTRGCILLGQRYGRLNGVPAILSSTPAFNEFKDMLHGINSLTLTIER